MLRFPVAVGSVLLASVAFAAPPAPGQHFDCSDGGSSSCASDDTGCVPDTKDHLKCSDSIAKAFSTAIRAVIGCHKKQADAAFKGAPVDDEACEDGTGAPRPGKSAKEKLDSAIAKISGSCTAAQLSGAAALEALLFADRNTPGSLDAQNGAVYCDGSTDIDASGDDAGKVPASKDNLGCADTVGSELGKLVAAAIKCHQKMADAFFAGKDFAENDCEEVDPAKGKAALQKYSAAMDKLDAKGTCTQTCLSRPNRNALGSNILAQVEAANAQVYPCAGTTTTTTTSSTTTSTVATTTTTSTLAPTTTTTSTAAPTTTTTTTLAPTTTTTSTLVATTTTTSTLAPTTTTTTTLAPTTTTTTTLAPTTTTTTTLAPTTTTTTTTSTTTSTVVPTTTTTTTSTTTSTVVPTTTTTTTSTTTTTVPVCSCAGGAPSRLSFTTSVGAGNCGHLDSDTTPNFFPINCGGLYFGGAGVGVPLPSIIPDQGTSLVNTSCTGTTLTLSNTTSAQTGNNRNCTSVGCLFGPPLPIPNSSHNGAATSTCVINTVSANATGSADCNAGSTTGLNLPLSSGLFLSADSLPNRCSGGSTPGASCTPAGSACPGAGTCVNDTGRCTNNGAACVADTDCTTPATCETGACVAGANAGKGCITDADCPGSTCRTFIQPCPICNATTHVCNGGPNDTLACTPGDSAINGDYPTSHDCPPSPAASIGTLPIAFLLDSGTKTKTSVDLPSQPDVFCGFCKNKITNVFRNPAVPCTSDTNCAGGAGGTTSCGQRTAGAFTSNDVARTIVAQGSPAGALTTGGVAKPSTIVSIFCIPPTFNPLVDSAADLPGPGAVALQGVAQLLP